MLRFMGLAVSSRRLQRGPSFNEDIGQWAFQGVAHFAEGCGGVWRGWCRCCGTRSGCSVRSVCRRWLPVITGGLAAIRLIGVAVLSVYGTIDLQLVKVDQVIAQGRRPRPGVRRGTSVPVFIERDMEGYFVLIAIAGAGWILFS
jgi:hypothetical protein